MDCIACGKKLELIGPGGCPPERAAWSGGVVDKVLAGYGSRFDGDEFIVAVCDRCLAEAVASGRIVHRHTVI